MPCGPDKNNTMAMNETYFKGFPPTLIQGGTIEILWSGIIGFYHFLKKSEEFIAYYPTKSKDGNL